MALDVIHTWSKILEVSFVTLTRKIVLSAIFTSLWDQGVFVKVQWHNQPITGCLLRLSALSRSVSINRLLSVTGCQHQSMESKGEQLKSTTFRQYWPKRVLLKIYSNTSTTLRRDKIVGFMGEKGTLLVLSMPRLKLTVWEGALIGLERHLYLKIRPEKSHKLLKVNHQKERLTTSNPRKSKVKTRCSKISSSVWAWVMKEENPSARAVHSAYFEVVSIHNITKEMKMVHLKAPLARLSLRLVYSKQKLAACSRIDPLS